jgi:hypothetical protein
MDPEKYNEYQGLVYNLAQQAGMRFQVRNSLSAADLEPSLKIVIALPPDPGLAELAAAAPQAQFLAVNIPGLTASGNLSVITDNPRPEITGFIIGYIAAMVADDYRTGMLLPANDPEAQISLDAFSNGAAYFCGTCPSAFYYFDEYGNVLTFPQYIGISAEENPATYNGYADYLIIRRKVSLIYVYPGLDTPELLNYIGSSGVPTIGHTIFDTPPLYWVASIQPDLPKSIQSAWPSLISGNGGQIIDAPITIANINEELLSPGKQRLVYEVLAKLLSGEISITSPNP